MIFHDVLLSNALHVFLSATRSQNTSSLMDEDEGDDEWSDHDIQSVTSSIPDMSLMGSVSPK